MLYLEPSSRLLGLSLRSYLLQPGGDLAQVTSERIGEVLEGCKMTSLHHYSGAILELPDSTQVFVHVSTWTSCPSNCETYRALQSYMLAYRALQSCMLA